MRERRNLPAELKEEHTGLGWPCPEPIPETSAPQHRPPAWAVAKQGPGVSISPAQFPALPSKNKDLSKSGQRQKERSKPQQKNKHKRTLTAERS